MNKLVASACVLFLVVGCTGGSKANRLPTHKVTGKITMSGAAVPGASITFSGKDLPVASAKSDDQGNYILTTYDAGDGAAEGSYKVIVYKQAPAAAASSMPQHEVPKQGEVGDSGAPSHAGPAGGKAPPSSTSLLPEKYSKLETTDLQVTVKSGAQEIPLELK